VRELHTLEGFFCFLDFRLDLCFEPLDFVFFRGGEKNIQRQTVEIEEQKEERVQHKEIRKDKIKQRTI